MGNCIGYYNHKNFLLFLIYVVLGCSHSCFLAIWRLTRLVIMLNNPRLVCVGGRRGWKGGIL